MKLSSVVLARALGFVELNDLNPNGHVYFPAVVAALVGRFGFQKYPQKPEDFDEQKGVMFEQGYTGEVVIEKMTAWTGAIAVDMRTSTRDAQQFLISTLEWLRDSAGVSYEDGMIQRWGFLSQIIFYSDADLDFISPALRNLSTKVSEAVSEIHKRPFEYRTGAFNLSFDRAINPSLIASFTIERRADTPFSENKYFSTAPVHTDQHIQIVNDYEWDVMSFAGKVE